ncbi:MAG: MCE family protein [Propionibacteriales bacterium]|nr:MCE family protein [Propionibacteriales bacterium]
MVKGLRSTTIKLVVVALISLLAFNIIYSTMQDRVRGGAQVNYSADFRDVSGLRVGDNVRVAGVQVGKITGIQVDGRHARVAFSLLHTQPLLDSTTLVIRYQNLLGQRYVSLQQGPKLGDPVKPGATVPLSRTDPGFDLTSLLNGFKPLFDVLKPAAVNELARTIVQVMQGEGGTVEQLLAETTRLTSFVADRDQVLNSVLVNLTPVLQDLGSQGGQVRTVVRDLRSVMSGLARQRQSIGRSVADIDRMLTSTAALFAEAEDPTTSMIRSLNESAGMFATNVRSVEGAVTSFPLMIALLGRVTSYQNAANIYVCRIALRQGPTLLSTTPGLPSSKVCRP